MRIDQNNNVSEMSGMLETKDFSINLDGMMFNNLINGMYSDKIAAPIREISTNARDGHAAVGLLNTPFDVCLPSAMKPTFSVRDFGCSLTHEEVMHMYSVLGKSTKRESDEMTGCLGLGSKSPFAYTSTFNVTCWKDGEMRVYSAYISTGGQPSISLVSREPSTEPTGVLVSIAVKKQDVSSFNTTANKVYVGFSPKPNVTNSDGSYKKEERKILYEGTGWKIFDEIDSYRINTSYAIQGSVAYPIDNSNADLMAMIKKEGTEIPNNRYSYRDPEVLEGKLLKNCPMIIEFDIGELSITTSRESLAYNEKTCKSIVAKLGDISKEVKKTVNAKYEKCDTLINARILLSEDVQQLTVKRILDTMGISIDAMEWKNQIIRHKAELYKSGNIILNPLEEVSYNYEWKDKDLKKGEAFGGITILDQYKFKNKAGSIKASFKWSSQRDNKFMSDRFHEFYKDTMILIQCTDVENKSDNNKLRNFWMNKANKSPTYWFRVKDKAEAKRLIDYIECNPDNVVYLNDLDDLKMPSRAKSSNPAVVKTKDTIRTLKVRRWGDNYASFEELDHSCKDEQITYYQKGQLFYPSELKRDNDEDGWQSKDIQAQLFKWSEILNYNITRAVVINSKNIKLKKKLNIFIDAQDWVERELKKEVKDIEGLILKKENHELVIENPQFFATMKLCNSYNFPKRIIQMIETRDKTMKLKGNENSQLINLYEKIFPVETLKAENNLKQKKKLRLNVQGMLDNDRILDTLIKAANERYSYSFNQSEIIEGLNKYLKQLKEEE